MGAGIIIIFSRLSTGIPQRKLMLKIKMEVTLEQSTPLSSNLMEICWGDNYLIVKVHQRIIR